MSIWNRPTVQTYYQSIDRIVNKGFLDKESPEYLLRVDFQTYLDYLVSHCEWQPLEWDESRMTVEQFTRTIERPSQWDPPQTYREEIQQFRLRIPVSPLVLLHANTGNADSWQYNIPGFVEARYRVITFDRRGWGRSTADADSGPQPGTIAEDLHALVEYLKLDRFHLVGVAGGGFAAYDYVLWHPERVRSMVIAASVGAIVDEELRQLRQKTALPGFASWPPEFREVSMGTWRPTPKV